MVGKVSDKVVNENAYSLINQVQNSPKDLRAVYNKLEEIKKELESRSDRNNLLSNGDSNINDYIVDFLEKLRNNFYSFFQSWSVSFGCIFEYSDSFKEVEVEE